MAIDSSPFIAGWDLTSPKVGDPRGEGANQIKAMKTAIHNSFPNVGGPVEADHNLMNQIFQAALPQVGMIMMFNGDTVPAGWGLCDGNVHNGIITPDLRGRFIMGATDTEKIGTTGGSNVFDGKRTEGHALSVAEMPSHDHGYKRASYTGDSYWQNPENGMITGIYETKTTATGGGGAHSHALKGESRPAFYALSYIMYVGFPAS